MPKRLKLLLLIKGPQRYNLKEILWQTHRGRCMRAITLMCHMWSFNLTGKFTKNALIWSLCTPALKQLLILQWDGFISAPRRALQPSATAPRWMLGQLFPSLSGRKQHLSVCFSERSDNWTLMRATNDEAAPVKVQRRAISCFNQGEMKMQCSVSVIWLNRNLVQSLIKAIRPYISESVCSFGTSLYVPHLH